MYKEIYFSIVWSGWQLTNQRNKPKETTETSEKNLIWLKKRRRRRGGGTGGGEKGEKREKIYKKKKKGKVYQWRTWSKRHMIIKKQTYTY